MFTKGQKVTVISIWSEADVNWKGETRNLRMSFDHAVVHSCGKKQMVLQSDAESVSYKGRNFLPTIEQYNGEVVVERLSDEEAIALGNDIAQDLITKRIARQRTLVERMDSSSENYAKQMRQQLAHFETRPVNENKSLSELRAALRR